MKKLYTTERLILKNLSPDHASDVLKFYSRNKSVFEPYETIRSEFYYTEEYQYDTLRTESALFQDCLFLRYYVYLKSGNNIIGTISFKKSITGNDNIMILGYRFDRLFWNQGYAQESISYLINCIFSEKITNKLEAVVHPDNHRSIRLLNRLHFYHPLTACRRQEILLGNVDHLLFYLNNTIC